MRRSYDVSFVLWNHIVTGFVGSILLLVLANENTYARQSAAIKKHGARTLLQIYHAGSQATSFMIGLRPVGLSDVPSQMSAEVPMPLSVRDIK